MEKDSKNLLGNDEPNPGEDFQRLWKMAKKGINEDAVFDDKNIDPTFKFESSLDWVKLRRIAHQKTETEKLWDWAGHLSDKRLAGIASIGMVAVPLLLIFIYNWGIEKIHGTQWIDKFMGVALIICGAGLGALVIGAVFYIVLRKSSDVKKAEVQVPQEEDKTITEEVTPVRSKSAAGRSIEELESFSKRSTVKQPTFKSRAVSMLSVMAIGISVTVLLINLQGFFFSVPNDQLAYEKITIGGSDRLILHEYATTLNKEPEKITLRYDSKKKPGDTVLVNSDPEYLNAVAVKFEKEGKKFEAAVVYSIAEKTAKNNQVASIQNNIWEDKMKIGDTVNAEYSLRLNRYISDKYLACLPNISDCIGDLATRNNADIYDNDLLNLKAVWLESIGKKDSALLVYKYLLNYRKEDIMSLLNARKAVAEKSLNSLIFMAGASR